jgi:hypothetical protein
MASHPTPQHPLESENHRLAAALVAAREERDAARKAFGRTLLELSDRDKTAVALVAQCADLDQRCAALRKENASLQGHCLELDQQITQLIYLHVATSQLHGTFDRAAVLTAIREIVINLIGSEELGIWGLDEKAGALPLIDSFGLDRETWRSVPLDAGVIGLAALTGEPFVVGRTAGPAVQPASVERDLTACIPLKLGSNVVAVLGIFGLLPQKPGLEPLDFELFELLASHGAEALVRSNTGMAQNLCAGGAVS